MQAPKRKTSPSRRNMRRAHDFLTVEARGKCSNCGAPKASHHVCPACGYYKGRKILPGIEQE